MAQWNTDPETNVTTSDDFIKIATQDFIAQFSSELTKILSVFGVTRKIPLLRGGQVKVYDWTLDIKDGDVEEGAIIPLSKASQSLKETKTITFGKWRKSVTAEAISDYGYENAVNEADAEMLAGLSLNLATNFYTVLFSGTGTVAPADTFKMTLARVKAGITKAFKHTSYNAIAWVNTDDFYDYIGGNDLEVQSDFGMDYIQKYLGYSAIFINDEVPRGEVWGTATNNMVFYHLDANNSEVSKVFGFESDANGYIGVKRVPQDVRLTMDTIFYNGILLFPEKANGVIKGTFTVANVTEPTEG